MKSKEKNLKESTIKDIGDMIINKLWHCNLLKEREESWWINSNLRKIATEIAGYCKNPALYKEEERKKLIEKNRNLATRMFAARRKIDSLREELEKSIKGIDKWNRKNDLFNKWGK